MNTSLQTIYNCPDCNAVATVLSPPFNRWQCTCGKILALDNGKVSVSQLLPVTASGDVLQPGCTGVWKEQAFTITGRVRAWFDDAVLNYWTLLLADQTVAWLCEGYGLYTILEQDDGIKKITPHQLSKVSIENRPVLEGNHQYQLILKVKSWKLEAEGKIFLPFQSSGFKSFDFAAENGSCITILQGAEDEILYYKASNVKAEALSLKGLKNQTSVTSFTFQCTECPEKVEVKTFPYALSCACKRCGTGYHYIPYSGFKKTHTKKDDFTPQFTLGESGILDGISWQILGYAQKEEDNIYRSRWREYTLYNPNHGYAFLSEFDGHWIFLKERNQTPVLLNESTEGFTYANESFSIFNKYRHTIISAAGEFPYDIYNKKDVEAKEFISPPEIWIREKGNKEGITWFFGHHVRKADLKKTFPLEYELPYKKGIGAVQPTGYINPVKLGIVAFCVMLLFIVMHGVSSFFNENRVVFEGNLQFDSTNAASAVTPPLELNKYSSNLKLILSAPVLNSWVEVGATLVNTTTGKEYSVEQGVEFYSGFSDGESWSEGSKSSEVYFTAIPTGTYRLQLQASRDYNASYLTDVNVKAVYSVESSRNLFASVIIIIIAAVGTFYVTQIFEKQRWYNSPFSVYTDE